MNHSQFLLGGLANGDVLDNPPDLFLTPKTNVNIFCTSFGTKKRC